MAPPLVWNGLILARAPDHPFLTPVWSRIANTILTRSGDRVWHLLGPGLFRDVLGSGDHEDTVRVLLTSDLTAHVRLGSSMGVLPREQHWSRRQLQESLYFSDPRRRCLTEASRGLGPAGTDGETDRQSPGGTEGDAATEPGWEIPAP